MRWEKRWLLVRCLKLSYESSPRFFLLNTVFFILSGLFSGMEIYAMTGLINGIQESVISGEIQWRSFLFFAGVRLLFSFLSIFQSYTYQRVSLEMERYLNNQLMEKCNQLELKDFETEESYALLNRANDLGKEKILQSYRHFLSLLQSILAIFSIAYLLFSFHTYQWMVILLIPVISSIVNIHLGRLSYQMEQSNVELIRESNYLNYLMTNDISAKEIISFRIGDYFVKKYKQYAEVLYKRRDFLNRRYMITTIGLEGLDFFVMVGLIIQQIRNSIREQGLVGDVMGFIYSIESIKERMGKIFYNLGELYKDRWYVEEFFRFMDKELNISQGDKIISEPIHTLKIQNLSYSYQEDRKALTSVNLTLQRNRMTVLLGENGSGKSTLIKIIAGLYTDYQGEIWVNNEKLRNFKIESYRRRVSVIFQDFNKYELTLRENLAVSDLRKLKEDRVLIQALSFVELAYLAEIYSQGLDTRMGHWFGREELSRGQWQRIAIARMILKESDVIIMDEPTAALDKDIEKMVFEYIARLSKEKIVVIVTHRVENVLSYHPWLATMNKGEIINQGFPEDLDDQQTVLGLYF